MKQNKVNIKRRGFLAKESIYLINSIFNYYVFNLERKSSSKQITERFIASIGYNRCILFFLQFPTP
jgi:hypothetical protein